MMYPRVSGAQITVNHSKGLFEVKCTIHIICRLNRYTILCTLSPAWSNAGATPSTKGRRDKPLAGLETLNFYTKYV